MNVVVWIGLGWLAVTFWTALGAHLQAGHLIPDAAVVTVVFLALRREPLPLVVAALALGYLSGRQALAPSGLHETVLVLCALVVYFAGGAIAGGGAMFFALASGGAVMLYHLLLFVLGRVGGGELGFTGWTTAALLPSGFVTAALALVSYPAMNALERRLSSEEREELSWR